jgi:hypothetical protein
MRTEITLVERERDVKELWVGESRQEYLKLKNRLIALTEQLYKFTTVFKIIWPVSN